MPEFTDGREMVKFQLSAFQLFSKYENYFNKCRYSFKNFIAVNAHVVCWSKIYGPLELKLVTRHRIPHKAQQQLAKA